MMLVRPMLRCLSLSAVVQALVAPAPGLVRVRRLQAASQNPGVHLLPQSDPQ